MGKKLAGTLFVYNGNIYDYSFKEAIQCLLDFCDHVIIVAGGDDTTFTDCVFMFTESETRVEVIHISKEQWEEQKGREKLNYFTNIAIKRAEELGYEYQFNLQADEIVHEKSYSEIRKAIETGVDGYMCKRINLWQSPYLQLDVPQERKPCSTSIIRLTKTCYRSVDDAENIGVPLADTYFENGIRVYHMGFVRNRKVMKAKITNMQVDVFGMSEADSKLKECDVFNPKLWFSDEDLKPIDEPLPKLIQGWAKERYYND